MTDQPPTAPARKPYTAPKLVVHGTVAQLTQGTTNEGCPSDLSAHPAPAADKTGEPQ